MVRATRGDVSGGKSLYETIQFGSAEVKKRKFRLTQVHSSPPVNHACILSLGEEQEYLSLSDYAPGYLVQVNAVLFDVVYMTCSTSGFWVSRLETIFQHLIPSAQDRLPVTWTNAHHAFAYMAPVALMTYLVRRRDTRALRLALLPLVIVMAIRCTFGYANDTRPETFLLNWLRGTLNLKL